MRWKRHYTITSTECSCDKFHLTTQNDHVYIRHDDLSIRPYGRGDTEQEAFEDLLQELKAYEQKLKNIRAEIQEHLNELKGGK